MGGVTVRDVDVSPRATVNSATLVRVLPEFPKRRLL
jgi:hypothetical protein